MINLNASAKTKELVLALVESQLADNGVSKAENSMIAALVTTKLKALEIAEGEGVTVRVAYNGVQIEVEVAR